MAGDAFVPAPPVDRAYLLKILDEEIARPFGHPLRPIVELFLNAADAVQRGRAGAHVDVRAEDGFVEVSDPGEGMDLCAILSRLLLPFATDRVPGVHHGRFGVGFFSVLSYGAIDPDSFVLDVETGDGSCGFHLHARAAGRGAAAISVTLSEIPPRAGTRVRVASALLDGAAVRAYLEDALHFFPRERAVVRVGGTPLNDGSVIVGGAQFQDEAAPGLHGRFLIGGRALAPGVTAATYHAGVKVRACYAVGELALVDFPGVIELTEGRDAIKPGPMFAAVAAAFHRRLARLGEDPAVTPEGRLRIAEIAAQISALMLDSAGFREAAPDLARALLGGRCLVAAERADAVIGFLGPGSEARVFAPESFWAAREWQGLVPGERELIDEEMILDPPEALASLARRRLDLPGLVLVAAKTRSPETVSVILARGRRREAGPLPCLGARGAVYVRADARAVHDPRGWVDQYALETSFARALGAREPDVERQIIVESRIARG